MLIDPAAVTGAVHSGSERCLGEFRSKSVSARNGRSGKLNAAHTGVVGINDPHRHACQRSPVIHTATGCFGHAVGGDNSCAKARCPRH